MHFPIAFWAKLGVGAKEIAISKVGTHSGFIVDLQANPAGNSFRQKAPHATVHCTSVKSKTRGTRQSAPPSKRRQERAPGAPTPDPSFTSVIRSFVRRGKCCSSLEWSCELPHNS